MFCNQCEEANTGIGCTGEKGNCGKTSEVSDLQDMLLWTIKGISWLTTQGRKIGMDTTRADAFITEGLFSTITNVNFSSDEILKRINTGLTLRNTLWTGFMKEYESKNGNEYTGTVPEAVTWTGTETDIISKASDVGFLSYGNEDVQSLVSILIHGIKGIAAYQSHATVLGHTDPTIDAFVAEALASTLDDSVSVDDRIGLLMKCGEMGVTTMALLDTANTTTYGTPEITPVNTGVGTRPGILVSGHDLKDLEMVLEQTKDQGVDIYTHGELLPAHGYPAFKEYDHLVGNYGSSWWHQNEDFETFNGPVLLTTNCLIPPLDSYMMRTYSTGSVGYDGIRHIPTREDGTKDFTILVDHARDTQAPKGISTGTVNTGFGHGAVLSIAETIVNAVKAGAIKRFFVMAGCDGREESREYYTAFAKALPQDTAILTAGCAKYRYNSLDLGDIGGIPRVIDAGQCNDSYSLVVVAMKLAEVFGVESVNDLPISYNIGWYEQKAVMVLLSLLHLGVKNIRLGPELPAFVSPTVLNVLVEKFNIAPITDVETDIANMMQGN